MSLLCAYCETPLERIHSIETEIGDTLYEKTEYLCSNVLCQHGIRVFEQSSRPLQKEGYITLQKLHRKVPPKSRLRRLIGEMTGHV